MTDNTSSPSDKAPLSVNCPTCQKKVAWTEQSRFRPFCSERCQQVDLGAWSTESYRIPSEPTEEWSEDELQSSNALSGDGSGYHTLQ